jgi:hypothetical protein
MGKDENIPYFSEGSLKPLDHFFTKGEQLSDMGCYKSPKITVGL